MRALLNPRNASSDSVCVIRVEGRQTKAFPRRQKLLIAGSRDDIVVSNLFCGRAVHGVVTAQPELAREIRSSSNHDLVDLCNRKL